MSLVISPSVRKKLATRHHVTEEEILECFANREAGFLLDMRENHQSDPPTQWFVAETDRGRKLKVAFINSPDKGIIIRTCYEANPDEIRIYNNFA
ncbi:ADP-ribosyl-(dinitrogen reductase) hydrolase [Enterovibrio baiacu]|uniref:ADP-ribosyl-(dinitrogen reductase) hydrolase n=1 Tax=Enterovibrio baiacu TaxID=2491023 RepID=UPI001010F947|nr:ADP-ribosyl-(dinitrogen reductase) hydrolase [Enterovibrio baiacu]MBE1276331.1 ADP-ribosyl-(dinitrogen reductase) hydrolase [Enterovibrio baiacu]